MGRTFPRTARLRSCLVVGASFAALAVSQNAHAQAQPCPNGQPGPVCVIDNTGASGAIVGTNGNATVVINTGTITGAPAILMAGSPVLIVNNEASGVITGTGGVAISAAFRLNTTIENSGTINGNVIINDAPGPNPFTAGLITYISDGGTLNGDLQLGTTGFTRANFIQRGADDGVTGTITAGQGVDIYTHSYSTSQQLALGARTLPATFEIEGFEVLGADTTLTLTGTGTTINLSGTGSVVNEGTISAIDTSALYPPGTNFISEAIGYYQPNAGVFPRTQIPPGQPGSFFSVFFGSALDSFTNTGVVNGDVNVATQSFLNAGDINLVTSSAGSTIYGAANTNFVFDNQGSIELSVTGARPPGITVASEFGDGFEAAMRLRSALNTTGTADVTIKNSGTVIGGLNGRFAADEFVFENSGSIEGFDIPGGYQSPGLVLWVGELSGAIGADPETHFDATSATIINGATGSIDHSFGAFLSAFEVTFENHGFIASSDVRPGALLIEQYLDAEVDATSLTFDNTGDFEGSVSIESETTAVSIGNSGTVAGGAIALNSTTFPDLMFGAQAAFEIDNETSGDNSLTLANSGSITTTGHAASGVTIEVEAGEDEPDDGGDPLIGNAHVSVSNSGTIAATGGATLVPQQFATWLQPGQFLINPLGALVVDATDVNGDSVITIDNQAGGLIQAGGTLHTAAPNGYAPIGQAPADVFTVAVFATGKTINITNSGTIQGGVGTTVGPNAVLNEGDLYDAYLAGAIHTAGDEYMIDGVEVYIASIDHVTNTASGTITGSIDLGGNDDTIDNAGSITGDVFLRDGNDSLANYGTLTGNLFFGAGDDSFTQGINATFTGTADGGDGEDRFLLDITGGGTINQAIYDQLLSFEILALTGSGTIDTGGEPLPVETIELGGEEPVTFGPDAVIETQGETAITGSSTGDEVNNQGTINGNVALGEGGDALDNSGVVNGTVDLGSGENQFANTGEINGDVTGGGDADAVDNEGTINGNVDLGAGGNQFANTGDVNGNVNAGDDNDSIVNDGTITGDVNLDGDAEQATALASFKTTQALGGGNDEFTNTNTLDGSVFAGGGDDVITNSGTITVDVELGDGDDELVLSGAWAIEGTAIGGTGSDTLDLTFGANTTNLPVLDLSGFESFEALEVSGGTGKIGGDATFSQINLAGGRLIGDHGSHITGNVQVGSGATFGSAGEVTGNIAVGSGGTLSPGASPAVMNVTGNVSLASGSTTVFEFVPAPGQSDQLLIDGNLTIASGAVLNMTGSRPLTPGVAYDMIVADAITGQFTVGAWDHNAIGGFLRYVDGTAADRLQLFGTFVAQGTLSPQAATALDYVNSLLVGGTASTALVNAVPSLLGADGFASGQAFTLLTPEPYASATQLGVESGLSLAKASRDGMASTDRETTGLFAIVNAFGNWRSLDADGVLGTSKAKNRNYGLIGGIGYGNAAASVGGFVGYVEGNQEIAALGSETDSDGFAAGIAGHFGSAGFGLDALIGYDWSDADTARVVPGAAAVSSGYKLENFVLDAVASYELPLGGVAVTPAVGITHIETKRGAANETGSAAFALDVDSTKHNSTFIDGSIAVSGTAGSIRPWAEVGIRHQVDGELAFASAALTGSTTRFFVPGAPRDETVFTAGAGVEATVAPNVNLTASYNGEFGGGTGSTAAIGLKAAF